MNRVGRIAGRGPTLALLLLGAGVGFVATAQPWWRADAGGAAVTFSGSDVTGGLGQALSAVGLAGVLLVLVLRRRGRRVLAVLLALTGLGMVAAGVLQSAPDAATVRSRVRQVSLTDQFALQATAWPWIFAAAGLLVLLGAGLLWWGAARWPERGARYERSTAAPAGDPIRPDAGSAPFDPTRAWKDLDAGRDPTADPDVRPRRGRDTMDPTHDIPRE